MLIPKGELERIKKEREHREKVEAEYIERLTDIVAEKVVSILLDKFDIEPKTVSAQAWVAGTPITGRG